MRKKVYHELPPIYHKKDKVLLLGSFPSPKSRENKFYYGHPQNRFWKILAKVFNEEVPLTIEDKKLFLEKNKIALWDVVNSCEIENASDSSITHIVPNDLNIILKECKIEKIFTLGKTATNLYKKYCYPQTKIESIYLPSTSPANCAMNEEELIKEFIKIKN